jgi:hypothetical protein
MDALINNRKKLITDYLSSQEQLNQGSFAIGDANEEEVSDGVPMFEVQFGLVDE